MQKPERLSLGEQNLNIRFAQAQQAQLPHYERSVPRTNSNRSSRAANSEAVPPHNVRATQQSIQSESTPIDIVSEVQQLGKKLNGVSRTIDQGGQFLVRKIQFFENQQQMNLFIFEQKESSAREKIIIEEARAIKTTEEIKQETQRLAQETAKKTAQQSNLLKPKQPKPRPWH